jgi:hypothetical protein
VASGLEIPSLLHERAIFSLKTLAAQARDVSRVPVRPYVNRNTILPFDLGLLPLFDAMIELAEREDVRLVFYHSPLSYVQGDATYREELRAPLSQFFAGHPSVVYRDWAELPLAPGEEACEGGHNTVTGNDRIAGMVLGALLETGCVP